MGQYFKTAFTFFLDQLNSFRINRSDTLVISGFARSGTTWLQQALAGMMQAKTIFEPLFWANIHHTPFQTSAARLIHSKKKKQIKTIYPSLELLNKSNILKIENNANSDEALATLSMFMPYTNKNVLNSGDRLYKTMANALKGKSITAKSLKLRKHYSESFLTRAIVKVIRGHLCLHALQSTFDFPVIHLYRDPRAIIASLKRLQWGQHWLSNLNLQQQLLAPDDGRKEYFNQFKNEILALNKGMNVARMTAYWALTENFLLNSYRNDFSNKIIFIRFEDIIGNPEESLKKNLDAVNIPLDLRHKTFLANIESPMVTTERKKLSPDKRKYDWKNDLSAEEINQIENITIQFGLQDRLIQQE